MPYYYYSSVAGSYTLTATINASATTVSLDSVAGLPTSTPYKMVLDPGGTSEEIVKVTGVAGTSLTVVRGWDGTAASSHSGGATARHMVTAEDLKTSRDHEAATTAVHGVTGAVVGTSDTQTLTNKNLSSGTNTFPTSLATLSGSQVLTNKDLSSASNIFPTALATLTGAQTLTNKTINAPAITGSATATGLAITNNIGTGTVPLTVKAMTGQTADLVQWINESAVVVGSVSKDGQISTKSATAVATSASAVPLTAQGAASQSANLAEFKNSAGTVLASVSSAGAVAAPNLPASSSSKAGSRLHWGTYTFTTSGAGTATFNHGAGFTPAGGAVTVLSPSGSIVCSVLNGITSTQATAQFYFINGSNVAGSQTITVFIVWGE